MKKMRPFFRHPGSKYLLARRLGAPRHDVIVEPFAGSATYSVYHGAGRRVILNDADPTVAALWRYLISASEDEIMALPVDFGDADVRTLGLAPEPMKLIQRWLGPQGGDTNWRFPPSALKWRDRNPGSYWTTQTRGRIASQLAGIRRWEVYCVPYERLWQPACELETPEELECVAFTDATLPVATWLVDPPYRHNSHARAKYGADVFDYPALGRWCHLLPGQTIVHEQAGATWLSFREFATARTGKTRGGEMKACSEVLWTNDA